MNKPMISFDVVINGPVAKAGSIFNLLSASGIKVPKIDANKITTKSDTLTVMLRAKLGV